MVGREAKWMENYVPTQGADGRLCVLFDIRYQEKGVKEASERPKTRAGIDERINRKNRVYHMFTKPKPAVYI